MWEKLWHQHINILIMCWYGYLAGLSIGISAYKSKRYRLNHQNYVLLVGCVSQEKV